MSLESSSSMPGALLSEFTDDDEPWSRWSRWSWLWTDDGRCFEPNGADSRAEREDADVDRDGDGLLLVVSASGVSKANMRG